MEILDIIKNIPEPFKFINNKKEVSTQSLCQHLFAKNKVELNKCNIQNTKQLTEYIENKSNKPEIFKILKQNIKLYIEEIESKLDYDKEIQRYLQTDINRETLIYSTGTAINSIIDSIFNKDSKLSHRKISQLFPDIYKKLYGSFEIYKENTTCHRQNIEKELIKYIPKDLVDLYPEARKLQRHFKIIAGPTNSGKTYEAMQELEKSYNGIYLGPLRLLAYEKYKELNDKGIIASLITGEEEIINENSTIQCSTVEMCDLNKAYDCIVLDETQLCTDENRGCYWTKVILGSICENIIICCAPESVDLIIDLINKCKDTYEIKYKERLVPLESTKSNYDKPIKGDAYIVFSRKNVHQLANELKQNTKKKISILYGNLPYDVRQEEARKFNNNETELLVATDCIGMGLNLPIQRVVLMETQKFDGKNIRTLYQSELKQIIGRAGRYNRYNKGYYTGESIHKLQNILLKDNKENVIPYIDMPKSLLKINAPIKNILGVWKIYNIGNEFNKSNIDIIFSLCNYADKLITDRQILWKIINFKFDYKEDIETKCFIEWKKMVKCLANNVEYKYKPCYNQSLLELEEEYKVYDLIYQFYGLLGDEIKRKETIEIRNKLSNMIMKELDDIRNNKKWFH